MPDQQYVNWILDSTRWNAVDHRNDDIVVVTPYKSGTTWMQNIVLHLVFNDGVDRDINAHSPWVENRNQNIHRVNEIDHRRVLKSHLPADGIDIREGTNYIVVGRDPRDVFVSLWNQYRSYTEDFYRLSNHELPYCPQDPETFWKWWTQYGSFDIDNEGYPHWSNFRHMQTWWDIRNLPNVHVFHYDDLINHHLGMVQEINHVVNTNCDKLERIVEQTTFEYMKTHADVLLPGNHKTYKDGSNSFFHHGTSGNWKDFITWDYHDDYEKVCERNLTPECRQWLERN